MRRPLALSLMFLGFACAHVPSPSRTPADEGPTGTELALKTEADGQSYRPLASIGADFQGEEYGKSRRHPGLDVKYLSTEADRDLYRVIEKNGRVYRINRDPGGNLTASLYSPLNQKFDYVMDAYGNLYLVNESDEATMENVKQPDGSYRREQRMRHSSIEAGGFAAAAGELWLDGNARITGVNLHSGHYRETETQANMDNLLKELSAHGVTIEPSHVHPDYVEQF